MINVGPIAEYGCGGRVTGSDTNLRHAEKRLQISGILIPTGYPYTVNTFADLDTAPALFVDKHTWNYGGERRVQLFDKAFERLSFPADEQHS